jgi:hypothetical protein
MSETIFGAAILPTRLLPHLPDIGLDPVHRLGFAGKTLDQPLVALAIADDHVPARARLVRERLHDRCFFGMRHGGSMRLGGRGCHPGP